MSNLHKDIIFLHAPSVYDFRKKPIFYGPVSDVIPSSPVFEMYPVGFMTISSHLEAAGFRTRIVNVAVRMLQSDSFDAEELIRKLDADVFAIDLHWMPHAHGALELAKVVKRHHPEAKVEFGGLTSSYFYDELIRRPEVDLVMRGDTTEEPTVKLMETLQKGGDLSQVPNLVWKDESGGIHDNGLTFSLESLDSVRFDYGTMIKNVLRNMDIKGALPWFGWDRLPLTSVFTVRGCSINCAECGGSHYANGTVVCRKKPAFRSPEKLAEDMDLIQSYLDTPIFIVGDLRQAGNSYAERFLKECRERRIKNHVVVELFNGAGPDYFTQIDRSLEGGWSIEFSPDSHDEKVRSALGKGYTNEAIERTIPSAFDCGCSRFDLFYMNGLPFQDRESALDSARAAKKLWASVKRDDGLFIYNAPFAPFVDPGSRIFENPEEWGYTLRARTLEEHRRLLDNPSWKHVLSYETKWMSRDDVAEISYDAALELAACEHGAGRISDDVYRQRIERTETARDLMHRIDEIMLIADPEEREARLWETKDEGTRMMNSTIANKKDLDWDAGSIWSNGPRVALGLAKSFFRH
ncbi:MAG: TIGR04190 family B12-binding domain/radical SAM domain protein [Thermoplasmata archaeon]|nr:TIGR04190 family B12-binding domain/radical SAM domain protein [Thermoplasmata archaeon]